MVDDEEDGGDDEYLAKSNLGKRYVFVKIQNNFLK